MSTIVTSRRLKSRVLLALSGDEPLRTSEVAGIVGASVTATRAALESVGAIRIDTVYPTEWTITPPTIPEKGSKAVPSKFTGVEYVVTSKAVDDIVGAWNAQCAALGTAIAASAVVAGSDPKKLAKDLGTVAGSIAALSYALNGVAGKPDWLDILTPDK